MFGTLNNDHTVRFVALWRWWCWWEQDGGAGGGIGDADVEPPSRGAREEQEDIGEVSRHDGTVVKHRTARFQEPTRCTYSIEEMRPLIDGV